MTFQDERFTFRQFFELFFGDIYLLSILTDTFNGFCDSYKISYKFVLHVAYVLIGLSRMIEIQF